MNRSALTIAFLLVAVFHGVTAKAGRIVYLGLDPTSHNVPEAGPLMFNAASWAGGSADPSIAVVNEITGFGGNTVTKLGAQGFTDVTSVASGSLTAIDLSVFDLLYVAPTTAGSTVANLIAASSDIAAFVAGGGGLVVEPEVFAAGSWSWVPDAALIGHSGSTNDTGNTVTIVEPLHPVMSGLSSAGLSNWLISVHSTFATPGAAGYTTLATKGGVAAIIVKDTGPEPPAVPEPGTLLLVTTGALGLFAIRRRRGTEVAE